MKHATDGRNAGARTRKPRALRIAKATLVNAGVWFNRGPSNLTAEQLAGPPRPANQPARRPAPDRFLPLFDVALEGCVRLPANGLAAPDPGRGDAVSLLPLAGGVGEMPRSKGVQYVSIYKPKRRNKPHHKWLIAYYENEDDPHQTVKTISTSLEITRSRATVVSLRLQRKRNGLVTEDDLRHVEDASRVLAAGMPDDFDGSVETYRAGHLEDYREHLAAIGDEPKQVQAVYGRCLLIIRHCDFTRITHVKGDVVQSAVNDLREEKGWSNKTANDYLKSMRQFTGWLRRPPARLRGADPLEFLKLYPTKGFEVYVRRALDADEVRWLLTTTLAGEEFMGLSGEDRYMIYFAALYTGLRRGELASLTPESFELDCESPIVTVRAQDSKHRRTDEVHVRPDVAAVIAAWLKSKPKRKRVFKIPEKAFLMVRADLRAARAAWLREAPNYRERRIRAGTNFLACTDDQGRVIDFHALRHTFGTLLGDAGTDLQVIQELMRHSDIRLTRRYVHNRPHNVIGALHGLPSIPNAGGTAGPQIARATGTDGPEPRTAAVQRRAQRTEGDGAVVFASNAGEGAETLEALGALEAPVLPDVYGRISPEISGGLRNRRLEVRALLAASPHVEALAEVTPAAPAAGVTVAPTRSAPGAAHSPAAPETPPQAPRIDVPNIDTPPAPAAPAAPNLEEIRNLWELLGQRLGMSPAAPTAPTPPDPGKETP